MDTPDFDPTGAAADAPDSEGGERIAKRLARAGLCSRRDAERWITEGRVAVNGTVLTSPAFVVRAGDIVQVDGKPVPEPEPTRLWRYHKQSGLVTTARDEKGRETVFDRMPPGMPRVVSVGRLDLTTEGLLLLTNDGELARFLELPTTGWTRRYRVRVFGEVDEVQLAALAKGPTIEGVKYGPVEAVLDRVQGRNAWLTVSIKEGKNREIRKLMESLGLTVNRLIRVAYGPFQLGKLLEGEVEEVPKRIVKEQASRFFTGEAAAPAVGEDGVKRPASRSGVGKVAAKPFDAKAGWAKAEPKAPGRTGSAKPRTMKQAGEGQGGEGPTGEGYAPERAVAVPRAAVAPSRGKAGWARPKSGTPGEAAPVRNAKPAGVASARADSAPAVRQDVAPAGQPGSPEQRPGGKPVRKAGWAKAAPKTGGTGRGKGKKSRPPSDDVAGARPATGAPSRSRSGSKAQASPRPTSGGPDGAARAAGGGAEGWAKTEPKPGGTGRGKDRKSRPPMDDASGARPATDAPSRGRSGPKVRAKAQPAAGGAEGWTKAAPTPDGAGRGKGKRSRSPVDDASGARPVADAPSRGRKSGPKTRANPQAAGGEVEGWAKAAPRPGGTGRGKGKQSRPPSDDASGARPATDAPSRGRTSGPKGQPRPSANPQPTSGGPDGAGRPAGGGADGGGRAERGRAERGRADRRR